MYEEVTFQDIDDTVEKVIYAYSNQNKFEIKNLNVKNVVKGWKMVQFVGSAGKLVYNLHSPLCR